MIDYRTYEGVSAPGTVTIFGTVTNTSGSAILSTAVTITQTTTGQVRNVLSNERRNYVAAQLPIGNYSVVAERTAVNQDRTDLTGNPFLDTGRPNGNPVNRYFNTNAFTFNTLGTFGTSGRNILRGPGEVNTDVGLFKNIPLHERHRL